MKAAIFPGSFDPVTTGHVEIVSRGLELFDEIVFAIGINSAKKYMFDLDQRVAMIKASFPGETRVRVESYEGLTADFADRQGIHFLLRGLRNGLDLEYERPIAAVNKHLNSKLETVFLLASGETSHVSSTIVREAIRYKADLNGLVPAEIIPMIYS